ncbi:hypothetical protein SGPA1_31374 [Streptomyces misionensis JCM 4497]
MGRGVLGIRWPYGRQRCPRPAGPAPHGLPGLPPAGGVARGGRADQTGRLRRLDVLGQAGARLRPRGRPAADHRPGPGGARRQPHRAHVHRRPLRGRALPGAVRRGPRQPPHRGQRRRRTGTVRSPDHRARALRAARQQADPRRARHLPVLAGPGAASAAPHGAGRSGPRRLRLAGGAARVRRGGLDRPPAPPGLRPRHPGRARRPGPLRLLPCQPAQHLHRPAHPGDAARGPPHGREGGGTAGVLRPGAPARPRCLPGAGEPRRRADHLYAGQPQGCHTYRTSGSRSSLPWPSVVSTATKPWRS